MILAINKGVWWLKSEGFFEDLVHFLSIKMQLFKNQASFYWSRRPFFIFARTFFLIMVHFSRSRRWIFLRSWRDILISRPKTPIFYSIEKHFERSRRPFPPLSPRALFKFFAWPFSKSSTPQTLPLHSTPLLPNPSKI